MTTPANQPDLIAWLRVQLDDTERDAPDVHEESCAIGQFRGFYVECICGWPARVLAEVDAKRRILDEYEKALDRRRHHPDDLASAGALLQMMSVVNLLALPYAGHPDYRPEWRPA